MSRKVCLWCLKGQQRRMGKALNSVPTAFGMMSCTNKCKQTPPPTHTHFLLRRLKPRLPERGSSGPIPGKNKDATQPQARSCLVKRATTYFGVKQKKKKRKRKEKKTRKSQFYPPTSHRATAALGMGERVSLVALVECWQWSSHKIYIGSAGLGSR